MTTTETTALIEHHVAAARRTKQNWVDAHGDELDESACDLHSFAIAMRAGKEIAYVYAAEGPTGSQAAAYMAAALMRADEVVMVADTRMRSLEVSEGEDTYAHGDMETAWNAGERDGITECLVVSRIGRDGSSDHSFHPYERNGRLITWLEPIEGNNTAEGGLVDMIRLGFEHGAGLPELLAEVSTEADMGPADLDRYIDMAAAGYIAEKLGAPVALAYQLSDLVGEPEPPVMHV